jgi:hypothetical protein
MRKEQDNVVDMEQEDFHLTVRDRLINFVTDHQMATGIILGSTLMLTGVIIGKAIVGACSGESIDVTPVDGIGVTDTGLLDGVEVTNF